MNDGSRGNAEDASDPSLRSSEQSRGGEGSGPSGAYAPRSEGRREVRPTRRIANAVVILLITQIVVLGAQALALLSRIRVLDRARAGDFVTLAEAEQADDLVAASAVGWLVLFAVTAIVWCVWQLRAQRNAIALAFGKLQFTPGWAVGWWFVPVANLFKPFQTVRELWKASRGGYEWQAVVTWSVIGWWWGLWLGANALQRFVVAGSNDTVSDIIRRDTWGIVANGIIVVVAILAIMIVRSVVALQEWAVATPTQRAMPPMPSEGGRLPEPPPPPPG